MQARRVRIPAVQAERLRARAEGHAEAAGARGRGEVDVEVRREDIVGVRGLGEVPALEGCEYAR